MFSIAEPTKKGNLRRVFLVLMLVVSNRPLAKSDIVSSGENPDPIKHAGGLPECVQDREQIDRIKEYLIKNKKNSDKYRGYKEVLQGISDDELRARLIYAETKAARCPKNYEPAVLSFIAGVIDNRIRSQNNVGKVVFQRDQFASSLNVYPGSMYQEFLCPKDKTLWVKSLSAQGPRYLSRRAKNYYLYKHFKGATHPSWEKEYSESDVSRNSKIGDCIKVFEPKLPGKDGSL